MERAQETAIEAFAAKRKDPTMLLGHGESGEAYLALSTGRVFIFDTAGARREVTQAEGVELAKLLSHRQPTLI